MRDHVISFGSAPSEEPCAQLDSSTYPARVAIECCVLRRMIGRRYPPPPPGSARLAIQHFERDSRRCREVCVRFRDRPGAEYALMLEADAPNRWDQKARAELIWYVARHLFHTLVRAQWLAPGDIPSPYQRLEPPEGLEELVADRRWLFSPDHSGGPFDARFHASCDSEWTGNVLECRTSAVILGPLQSPLGRGWVVRRDSRSLYLYNGDLSRRLAPLSDALPATPEPQRRDEFLVRVGSGSDYVLSQSDSSALFEATDELEEADRQGRDYAIWQILAPALRNAVPISATCEIKRAE